MSPPTPKVFFMRHGETPWSKSGQYTGTTEKDLTPHGRAQVLLARERFLVPPAVGQLPVDGPFNGSGGGVLDPARLACTYVSPRVRARRSYALFMGWERDGGEVEADVGASGKASDGSAAVVDLRLEEWKYGMYEGMLTHEIREARRARGLDTKREWDIWRDGCEGGESPAEVQARIDSLIIEIRDEHHAPALAGGRDYSKPADIFIVAHGHILRAFVKRWLGFPMDFPLPIMMEPAALGVLSYQHHSIAEPAVMLGLVASLPSPSLISSANGVAAIPETATTRRESVGRTNSNGSLTSSVANALWRIVKLGRTK